MGRAEILKRFSISKDGILHKWIKQYVKLLKENNMPQSISSKGSCVDNVTIEFFFSILKSECIYLKQNLQKHKIEEVVKTS